MTLTRLRETTLALLVVFVLGCGPGNGASDSGPCPGTGCPSDSGAADSGNGPDSGTCASAAGSCTSVVLLVDGEWLEANLGDPDVQVVDLRALADYDAGHIPGAVHLDPGDIREDVGGIPAQVASIMAVAAALGSIGLSRDATVVTYDDNNGLNGARLLWTMEYYDHPDVRLLDGGWPHWMTSGRPVSTDPAGLPPTTYPIDVVHDELRVDGDWINAALTDPSVVLIDARSPAEYSSGRIPGALSFEWQPTNLVNGLFKPREELLQLYAGIPPEATLITYCQTGTRASVAYFVLRWLGYPDVRLYDGSWAEWGSRPELPVETD